MPTRSLKRLLKVPSDEQPTAKQTSGGDDLAEGTSASLEEESLESGRLEPGRYRIEAHAWLSPPGNTVVLTLTFFNRRGEPGT